MPGADAQSQQGLTGAIHNLTEETGSLIAGQFFAFREIQQKTFDVLSAQSPQGIESVLALKGMADITNKSYMTGLEQLDGINQSVTHLAKIEINTRPIYRLNEIADLAKETNTILKERL